MQERFARISDGPMATVWVGGEAIRCTGGHVVWVASGDGLESRPVPDHALVRESMDGPAGRWVLARDVRAGDTMVLRTRAFPVPVERVSVDEASVAVFNLRVAGCPTFAVGVGGLLVHNMSWNGGVKNSQFLRQATLERHAQWGNDLVKIDRSILRLATRALRTAHTERAGWTRAEALLELYLIPVAKRLLQVGSRYGVEWQAAGLRSTGARVSGFEVIKYGQRAGQRVATPGSKRLEVVVTMLSEAERGARLPLRSPHPTNRVLRGYDITMDPMKTFTTKEYSEAFRSMRSLTDIQIMSDGKINIFKSVWMKPGPTTNPTVYTTVLQLGEYPLRLPKTT